MPTVPMHARNVPRIPDWNMATARRPTGTLFQLSCDDTRSPKPPHASWGSHTHRERGLTARPVPVREAVPHPPCGQPTPPSPRPRFSIHRPSYENTPRGQTGEPSHRPAECRLSGSQQMLSDMRIPPLAHKQHDSRSGKAPPRRRTSGQGSTSLVTRCGRQGI